MLQEQAAIRTRGMTSNSDESARLLDELRQSQERYRSFVQLSTEGIWRFEVEQPVPTSLSVDEQIERFYQHAYLAECNDAMARMYGYASADDIRGARLGDFLVRDDPDNLAYLQAFVGAGYQLTDVESHEMDREGHPKYFLNNLIGVVEQGALVRAWGTQRDISERKQMEQELREREERFRQLAEGNEQRYLAAEEGSRTREEFMSVAAHELKTPLTSLRGAAQILQRRMDRWIEEDPERLRHWIKNIDLASARLAHLVNDLLDISRIQAGRLAIDPEPANVSDLVASVAERIQANAPQHEIRTHVQAEVEGIIDPSRIEQVVTNLLDNAVKYSPDGGPIDLELQAPDPHTVRIVITDRGIGIAPEHREHIFEAFYQATPGQTGLGLGLHISRQIVELHGGRISAEHPSEGGTRFVVQLPLRAA
jgi:signal transduction histidine kinase